MAISEARIDLLLSALEKITVDSAMVAFYLTLILLIFTAEHRQIWLALHISVFASFFKKSPMAR